MVSMTPLGTPFCPRDSSEAPHVCYRQGSSVAGDPPLPMTVGEVLFFRASKNTSAMNLQEDWGQWWPVWCSGGAVALRTGLFLHWDLQGGIWRRLQPAVRFRILLVPVIGFMTVGLLALAWPRLSLHFVETNRFFAAILGVTLALLACKGADSLLFREASRPSGGQYEGAVTEEQRELASHE